MTQRSLKRRLSIEHQMPLCEWKKMLSHLSLIEHCYWHTKLSNLRTYNIGVWMRIRLDLEIDCSWTHTTVLWSTKRIQCFETLNVEELFIEPETCSNPTVIPNSYWCRKLMLKITGLFPSTNPPAEHPLTFHHLMLSKPSSNIQTMKWWWHIWLCSLAWLLHFRKELERVQRLWRGPVWSCPLVYTELEFS